MIYVVGLGVKEGDIALKGYQLIQDKTKKLLVKTKKSQTYCYFDGSEQSLDFVYDEAQDFDGLNVALADAVVKAEQEEGDVVYCVPGSGAMDASVRELKSRGLTFSQESFLLSTCMHGIRIPNKSRWDTFAKSYKSTSFNKGGEQHG